MLPGTKSLAGNEQLLFPPGGRTEAAQEREIGTQTQLVPFQAAWFRAFVRA